MAILNELHRSFFRKDSAPVWIRFAEEQQGQYIPESDEKVQYEEEGFRITFDAYTHYTSAGGNSYEANYTRGIIGFNLKDDYELLLIQQGWIENIGKLFGSQDIQTGNRKLDKTYMIKSNDELKTQLFLANPTLSSSLKNLKIVRFQITKGSGLWNEKPKTGNAMLYVVIDGSVNSIQQLHDLRELFTISINEILKKL